MLGERELDEDAVDSGVIVEFVDFLEKFGFGDVFGELDQLAVDVGLQCICQQSFRYP